MAQWFYGENGQQSGPVEDAEFHALIATQRIAEHTMIWREGMPAWQSLAEFKAAGGLSIYDPMSVSMIHPETSGWAIASLVLGILAVITCLIPLGFPAVVFGHIALHRIKNAEVLVVGRGMAITGLVMGYITSLATFTFIGFSIFIYYHTKL
jgi:hypothetical protein